MAARQARLDRSGSQIVGPARTCVGCRGRGSRSELVRLALAHGPHDEPNPRIVVDARKALPGRGAWIHSSPECLELAEKRKAIQRALPAVGQVDLAEVWAALASTECQRSCRNQAKAGPRDGTPMSHQQ